MHALAGIGSGRAKLAAAIAGSMLLLSPVLVLAQDQESIEYREGYELVLEQNWTEAQEYFTEYQQRWPESTWADDAAFWNCYSMNQSGADVDPRMDCFEEFITAWPQSSWVTDASSELAKLGSQQASRGNTQRWRQFFVTDDGWEFDIDVEIDAEEISRNVERAMRSAEQGLDLARREVERMRERGMEVAPIPPLPPLGVRGLERNALREIGRVGRVRGGADDELLSIIWALRDNEQATAILLDRLESSDDPALRRRIVLLLEDLPGDDITPSLLNVIRNDASEQVRNSAVYVLLDRGDASARGDLLELLQQDSTPLRLKVEIIDDMDDWDEQTVLDTLPEFLSDGVDLAMVAEAADTLAEIGSPATAQLLFEAAESLSERDARIVVIEAIGDIETAETLSFLSDLALNAEDDLTAVMAIEGISDREDNIAVSSLSYIYVNSERRERKMAAIEGIGETESSQAVDELSTILGSETDPAMIAEVLYALGDTDRPEAVAIAIENYRSNENEIVRRAAIRALRDLEDQPGATEAMLQILEEELN
jgi:HEAT repeat protein